MYQRAKRATSAQTVTPEAAEKSALQVTIQQVTVASDDERLPDASGIWLEAALVKGNGAKRAEYREPVANLDSGDLSGGIAIDISPTGNWTPNKLILRCLAHEPIGFGRTMSLLRVYELSAAGYAEARTTALLWLSAAQPFVAHALALVEDEPRWCLSALIHREEVQRDMPKLGWKTTMEGLNFHLEGRAHLPRALAWLEARGYVRRVGEEWHTVEWFAGTQKGEVRT